MLASSMLLHFILSLFLFPSIGFEGPICHYDEMGEAAGRWVYTNDTTMQKSFRCCGGDGNDWQDPTLVDFCRNNETLLTSGRGCFCDELLFTRHKVSEREKYVWITDHCKTLRWNATYFCELLGKRTLLLLGDSTMKQTASTLRTMIQHDIPAGKCGLQIVNRDTDFLVDWDRLDPRPSIPERATSYVKYINEIKPDIVVLATGAHYLNLDTYKSMWRILRESIEKIRDTYAHPPKFIWKTQNPGHHGCRTGDKEKPLGNISEFVQVDDKNKWNLHRTYDEIAKIMSAQIGMKLIDMSPLYLRADGHPGYLAYDVHGGDCLHYCMPGPLNIFSVFMMHILRDNYVNSGNDDDYVDDNGKNTSLL